MERDQRGENDWKKCSMWFVNDVVARKSQKTPNARRMLKKRKETKKQKKNNKKLKREKKKPRQEEK